MSRLFGTDGIRGVAGKDLNYELALKVGRALAYVLTKNKKDAKVIIGCDGRISKDMLVSSLIAGLTSNGVDVMNVGLIPTPAISYLTKKLNMDAGIMVTASHNPSEFNGIKIFDSNGFKLPDSLEDEIEGYITNGVESNNKIGKLLETVDVNKLYTDFILNSLKVEKTNLKILIDSSNGATSTTAQMIFNNISNNVTYVSNKPNGENINKDCGSLYIENLINKVIEEKYDFAVAFDGDGDRSIFIDNLGNIIDGDYILAIISKYLKDNNKLNKNTIVGTVMSNLGLVKYCKKNNFNFIASKVGDRYVLEELKTNNLSLGGEQSGHIILKEYSNTGDGELTALMITKIINDSNKTLNELSQIMKKYPQVLINAKVENNKKNEFYTNVKIKNKIEEYEKLLEDGRILVRPSGTEPLIRVMIEAEDQEIITKYAKDIAIFIENELK